MNIIQRWRWRWDQEIYEDEKDRVGFGEIELGDRWDKDGIRVVIEIVYVDVGEVWDIKGDET